MEVHCTSSTVEALKNAYRKASTSNDHRESNDTIKVYYPILLCSSTGHLHPSKIISSTSIAQTITRQDSNNLLHFENNFHPHITQSLQDFASSILVTEEKMRRKVVSNTPTIVFRRILLLLSRFSSGKPTQAHTSGFSYQTKIYRTCATKCPSAPQDKIRLILVPSLTTIFRANCWSYVGSNQGKVSVLMFWRRAKQNCKIWSSLALKCTDKNTIFVQTIKA